MSQKKIITLDNLQTFKENFESKLGLQIIELEDNGSTTAGTWLAKTDKISALVAGQVFLYRIEVAGSTTTKLNITGSGGTSLGAKTIYRYGTTKLTTQYAVDSYILLYYNGTYFYVFNDYDANSYAYVRQYQSGENEAGSGTNHPILTRYNLTNKHGSYDTAYTRFYTETYIDTSNGYIYAPNLGSASSKNVGTGSGNVPVLDTNGKLDASVLPAIAVSETFTASSQSAMLALTAQVGDVCVRTDVTKTYILVNTPASTLGNWKLLEHPADAVSSVNGKTGVVSLTASDVGALPSTTTIPTKTSDLTNDSGFITSSSLSGYVPTTRTVNGKALSSDISLTHADIAVGNLTLGDGTNTFYYRTQSPYKAGFYFQTNGDESLVFANQYKWAGWMFVNEVNPDNRTSWQSLTPILHIKNGGVAINKLIGQQVTPSYALDVNGSANATTLYQNGVQVATMNDLPQAVTSVNGLSGGTISSETTISGNLNAQYVKGTWLYSSSATEASSWTDVWVNNNGWLYKRSKANFKSDLDIPSSDDVHLTQNNTVIVGDALTNISGKSLSAYTSQETTVGGYPVIQILKNGSVLSEADASSYMSAQTGSSYVPKYNYDNPSFSYFIFSNGTIYKPQWDSTNGMLLYKMNQLAFKSDVPTVSISSIETTLNVNTAKTITLNGTLWKLPSGDSSSSSNVVKYYGINSTSTPIYVEGAHYYLLVPMGTTSGTIGGTTSSIKTFYGTAILYVPLSWSTQNIDYTLIYRSSATAGITSTTVAGRYVSGSGIRIYGACKLLDIGGMVGSGGLL